MTRIYRYTDGVTAGSISGASPFPFGTARSRPTTKAALYDEIVLAFLAAGWTRYNQGTRNDVWFSNGESGNEFICAQTVYTTGGGNQFNFLVGTKLNSSNQLMGYFGSVGDSNTYNGWSGTTSGEPVCDFQVLGTKDFILFNVRVATAGGGWAANLNLNFFIGQAQRMADIPPLTTTAPITSGTNVSVPVHLNPITYGYKPRDLLQIVEVGASGASAVASWVRVVDVTSSAIVVDRLPLNFTYACIGALPMPTVKWCTQASDIEAAASPVRWRSVLPVDPVIAQTNEITSGDGQGWQLTSQWAVGYYLNWGSANEFGSGTSTANAVPNTRGQRFGLRPMLLTSPGVGVIGQVPGVYRFPGTSTLAHYPSDTGTDTTTTPTRRYVAAKFLSSSTAPWMIGYMP